MITQHQRLVFVFPGQGSQHPGMAGDLHRALPDVRAVVEQASDLAGLPLAQLMARGPAERLAACDVAQVAVVAVSLGLLAHVRAAGVEAAIVMGHSAGEYSALVAAGVMDVETALHVVVERGRAMAAAARERTGAMAAITGMRAGAVERLCDDPAFAGRVTVAAYNAPGQVVVSGACAAVDGLATAARDEGATRVDRLNVGGAFHSPLMQPARRALVPVLAHTILEPARCTLVSSISGSVVADPQQHRAALVDQLTSPVRWTEAVATAARHGGRHFVELGPGRVLSALVRMCDRAADVSSVRDVPSCARYLAGHSAPAAMSVSA
jgi:[acyl-carrier-protein] S-malonyltransferase